MVEVPIIIIKRYLNIFRRRTTILVMCKRLGICQCRVMLVVLVYQQPESVNIVCEFDKKSVYGKLKRDWGRPHDVNVIRLKNRFF